MTLSDQLIRCWTAGMVALTASSLDLLLPLSSGSLVNIMYTLSCRGNCCLAFGGGDLGVGVVAGDQEFLLFLCSTAVSSHTAESCDWLACRSHCETCTVHLTYPPWCKVAELGLVEVDPAVFPQVFVSGCLQQPLDPLAAELLIPADYRIGYPADHLFSC